MSAEQRKELVALLDLRVEVVDSEAKTVTIEGVLPQAVVDGRGGSWHDSQA